MTIEPSRMKLLAEEVLQNKKYRSLNIPPETVMDLIRREDEAGLNEKSILKNVRKKMHHLIAPYLGDADYEEATGWLENAVATKNANEIDQTCLKIMNLHASTRERIPFLDDFYMQVFSICRKPGSILDLACGLNPFALPWMDLPLETEYHAYDIHAPRVNLINRFLTFEGRAALGEVRDILINPPKVKADMAFFFKEAHRMEQRRKGANRQLWQALKVDYLIVSLPANSLSGQHDLSRQMRRLVETVIDGLAWSVQEMQSGNELIFCIQK
jgi:16S rRNA (guanine(1405)-N(7))-methyltransferase